jgi:tetratricopeptide (TPR) repeat protein
MTKNPDKNWSFLICLMLTLVTLAVFYQVHSFNFINIDDPVYVSENPNIQTGFTLKTVEWAFTTGCASFWHPLTWLSYMLDWQFYGPDAGGYHLTNLIFHIANTLVLFLVLRQMTQKLWQSAFVAALFAIHPLHVESVAWIAERKDVLSTFFWLLTMWAYIYYCKRPKMTNYLLVIVSFVLGLMAKPMLVTLPFVFLLLDYWPLERIDRFQQKIIYRLVLEKIPFIILSAVFSVVALLAEKSGGAVPSSSVLPLKYRIFNVFISYVKYIEKLFRPSRLAVFYQHLGQNVSIVYALTSAGLLLAATVLVIRYTKNHRYLFTGWFWYLGTLVPVIGLVQVGSHAMADRYTYITLTGLFIIIAWGLPDLLRKWPYRKTVLWMSSILVLIILTALTYFQTRYWKDSITLYQHALAVTENNYVIHFTITQPLLAQGRIEEAIQHSSEAVRIKPDYVDAINALGASLYRAGKVDEAISYCQRALEIDPCLAGAHRNLVVAFMNKGRFADAEIECQKYLRIKPDDPAILNALGNALSRQGKLDEAAGEYEKILRLQPQNTDAKNNLNAVLAEKQKSSNNDAESNKK